MCVSTNTDSANVASNKYFSKSLNVDSLSNQDNVNINLMSDKLE